VEARPGRAKLPDGRARSILRLLLVARCPSHRDCHPPVILLRTRRSEAARRHGDRSETRPVQYNAWISSCSHGVSALHSTPQSIFLGPALPFRLLCLFLRFPLRTPDFLVAPRPHLPNTRTWQTRTFLPCCIRLCSIHSAHKGG